MTALPQVLAALHTRIAPPLAGRDASFDDRLAWLADELGDQLDGVHTAVPPRGWLHLICSTCLSPMLTGWDAHAQALADRLQARSAVRPVAMLQPYQCAAWGYALRFAGSLPGLRHVVLSIVDADLHDAV